MAEDTIEIRLTINPKKKEISVVSDPEPLEGVTEVTSIAPLSTMGYVERDGICYIEIWTGTRYIYIPIGPAPCPKP